MATAKNINPKVELTRSALNCAKSFCRSNTKNTEPIISIKVVTNTNMPQGLIDDLDELSPLKKEPLFKVLTVVLCVSEFCVCFNVGVLVFILRLSRIMV